MDDLLSDKIGLYVLMGNGYGGYQKVYIPDDEKMREDLGFLRLSTDQDLR